ncbi:MAG: transcriptional regulator EpsA [Rhodocyclaceae bacterium]|nr:MAG: transcriptional regulator EpsA [Rhodocyclaceae bacterium]
MQNIISTSRESQPVNHGRILQIVHESTQIKRQLQFMLWLQGELQELLPHTLLLQAYGDFSRGHVHYNVIPALPAGCLTKSQDIPDLVPDLFDRWVRQGRAAYSLSGMTVQSLCQCELHRNLRTMRSVLVHGLRDERQHIDLLYVLFQDAEKFEPGAHRMLELLLPHIDFASRRITDMADDDDDGEDIAFPGRSGLTARECEILKWVGNGKTNYEIGMILDISAFTVKNHLQRIFRKLDVINRAQAISKIQEIGHGGLPHWTGRM